MLGSKALCRRLLQCTAASAVWMLPVPAFAQAQTFQFDIPAQSLDGALRAFARSTHQQVLFDGALVRGKRSTGVAGSRTSDEALTAILAGSGLQVSRTPGGAYVVKLGNAPAAVETASSTGENDKQSAQEIVVTGTNIRGIKTVAATGLTITREQIDRSGYTSTQQLIQSLPQNFSGGSNGATEDGLIGPGSQAAANVEGASGVNLRGLGTTSTLVLINGRRLAPSVFGTAVDVSLIPLAALERVEVLTDGASAIYGSDAVAGVVNFITRHDFNGQETQVTFGAPTEGGAKEVVASQSVGRSWTGGGILGTFQYHWRDRLRASQREFTDTAPMPTDLLPRSQDFSGYAEGHQNIGSAGYVRGQFLYTDKSSKRHYSTPFETDYTNGRSKQLNSSVIFGVRPSEDWRVELAGNYSRLRWSDPTVISPPDPNFPNGEPRSRGKTSVVSADLNADGTVVELPAGKAKIAIGAFYRREITSDFVTYTQQSQHVGRSVWGGYGETYVPIFSERNARPLLSSLALSGAIRYDHYSDFGSTTNYRLAANYSPLRALSLKASWSTSFRAPAAIETVLRQGGTFVVNLPFADPSGALVPVFFLSGSDALKPETSKNLNFSAEFSPTTVSGLHLKADYFDIRFKNRIITPPFDPGALTRPDVYGSLLTSLADDAAASAYLANQIANGAIFFDTIGTGAVGVRYVFNDRQQNASRVRTSGFDLGAQYQFSRGNSVFDFDANLAIITRIDTQFASGASSTDLVNTYGNPLRLRGRVSTTWSRGRFSLTGTGNYSNSYTDTSAVPAGRVSDWLTFDATARIQARKGLEFAVAALNIFNKSPPRVAGLGLSGILYDTTNASPLGRFVSISAKADW